MRTSRRSRRAASALDPSRWTRVVIAATGIECCEAEQDERGGAGQLRQPRRSGQGIADGPVLQVQPGVVRGEGRERGKNAERGGVEVVDQPWDPWQHSGHGTEVGHQGGPSCFRVRPPQPQKLGAEDEYARVVGIEGATRTDCVGDPPARATRVEGEQHRESRQRREQHHHCVTTRLGRVIDHERREGGQCGGQHGGGSAHRAQPEPIDRRDRQRAGHDRGRADQLRAVTDLGRQPGQDEIQGRGDLGVLDLVVAVQEREDTPEAVRCDDPIGGELVGEQGLMSHDQPDRDADQHHQHDSHRWSGDATADGRRRELRTTDGRRRWRLGELATNHLGETVSAAGSWFPGDAVA